MTEALSGESTNPTGELIVVGTPIGNLGDLSDRTREVLRRADVVMAEDTRVSGNLLRAIGAWPKTMLSLRGGGAVSDGQLTELLSQRRTVALVTDAGMPGVSDPGGEFIEVARSLGAKVSVVPGPSAAASIIALANFDVSRFLFCGFLSSRSGKRRQRLSELVSVDVATVYFEAPHRIVSMLADLSELFGRGRRGVIGRELTKKYEEVSYGTLGELEELVGSKPPLGEYVLCIEGHLDAVIATHTASDVGRIHELLRKNRVPAKAASEILALVTGERRSVWYERYVQDVSANDIGS